jgi:hypothetical protein
MLWRLRGSSRRGIADPEPGGELGFESVVLAMVSQRLHARACSATSLNTRVGDRGGVYIPIKPCGTMKLKKVIPRVCYALSGRIAEVQVRLLPLVFIQ